MKTAIRRGVRLEVVLLIIALVCAAGLVLMVLQCLPYLNPAALMDKAGPPEASTDAAAVSSAPSEPETRTEPESEPETEPESTAEPEPTLPPPEENPYGRNDFQYNSDNFLTCLSGMSVNGIDVSSYQEEIDWAKVKADGIDFAIIRVALRGYESGKLVEDPYARANLEGAREAGLEVGVYIFSQAVSAEEALEEAEFLLEIIQDYEITMPVVFDWEQVGVETARTENMDPETLTAATLEFCRVVEEAGYTPMVYFNRYQAKHLMDLSQLTDYDFWLAAYTDRMTYGYKVRMWQYTDRGRVDGIEGGVDVNIWLEY